MSLMMKRRSGSVKAARYFDGNCGIKIELVGPVDHVPSPEGFQVGASTAGVVDDVDAPRLAGAGIFVGMFDICAKEY
jgi:hypothetical protein